MSETFYAVFFGVLAAHIVVAGLALVFNAARTWWAFRRAKKWYAAGGFEALLKSSEMNRIPMPVQNEKGEWLADCPHCFPIAKPDCATCHGSGSYWTKPPNEHLRKS